MGCVVIDGATPGPALAPPPPPPPPQPGNVATRSETIASDNFGFMISFAIDSFVAYSLR
jgi:hypothetical protein